MLIKGFVRGCDWDVTHGRDEHGGGKVKRQMCETLEHDGAHGSRGRCSTLRGTIFKSSPGLSVRAKCDQRSASVSRSLPRSLRPRQRSDSSSLEITLLSRISVYFHHGERRISRTLHGRLF